MPITVCEDCGEEFEGSGKVCPTCTKARMLNIPREQMLRQDSPVGNRALFEEVRRIFAEDIPQSVKISFVVAIVALLILIRGGFGKLSQSSFQLAAGEVAPNPPKQQDLASPEVWQNSGLSFSGLARYDITARVLFKVRVAFDSAGALAPYDLSVGWGKMSDTSNLRKVNFYHAGRFLGWNSDHPGLRANEIGIYLANMHIIPANSAVSEVIDAVDTDTVLRLRGYLVNISGPNFSFTSSLSRDDEGPGACEVMWVEKAEILQQ